jgi:hypothetical protein
MKLRHANEQTVVLEMTPNELDLLRRVTATVVARHDDLDYTVYQLSPAAAARSSAALEALVQQVARG